MKTIKKENSHRFIDIALIIILGFVVYVNSSDGKFLRDDDFLIKDNAYIKSWNNISNIFTKNIAAGGGRKWYSYRPLQMIAYMTDYSLWKLDARGYHITNILLHILTALVLYWFIYILFYDINLSLLTSLFFVSHPIHTEAVSFISGRADPLALLFMLICFIFYIKDTKQYIIILISYILALLSRENTLILPVLLLLYHYTFKIKLKNKKFFSILCLALLYIIIRLTLLKSLLIHLFIPTTFLQRIPGFFAAITNYTKLLLLPFNLHMEYGSKVFSLTNPMAVSGIVILCALLLYALWKRNTDRLLFFSILWFFISLLPVSNLYPLNAYMAEHWLYVPSIGFFLILAKCLSSFYRIQKYRTIAIFLIIGLISFYSYLTIKQNKYWQDPITFYERTLKYAPDNPDIYNNLADAFNDIGEAEKAISLCRKAIELNSNHAKAYINLGIAYRNKGNYEDAISLYKKAIELDPSYADVAYNNLGAIYTDLGRNDEAITMFNKAIEINPDYAKAYNNLALTYNGIGQTKQAIALLKKAIEIDPSFADTYNNLGVIQYNCGEKEEAIILFKKAVEIDPNDADLQKNLAIASAGENK